MNTEKLSQAIRESAAFIGGLGDEEGDASDFDDIRDAVELLRILAKVVEGVPLAKAFGSPGDWGYETPIGSALAGV